jgi:tyrosyl-tRNA synthetase
MDFFSELTWRGLVYDATEGAKDALARETVTGYIGFDPTAPSLHVGSLLQMVALAHLQRCGHSPIAVVGGGTGLIGDPSGKTAERALLTPEQVDANVAGIRGQLAKVLDFDRAPNPARIVNNGEWLTKLSAIEFMRDVGKHFSVNAMLTKDSVKRRIEGEEGISYTEFSYSLLQAYDFLELHRRVNCTLQLGGSDQWGNITAGMDLVRRVTGGKVHGLVLPLITTSAGTKFGKTEAGTIWLDPSRTSPYDFYQFWVNVDDRDAVRYLKFFTFLDRARIEEIEAASAREPEKRHAQRELAREVTRLVHSDEEMQQVERAAEKVFRGAIGSMSKSELLQVFASVGSAAIEPQPDGWRLPALVVHAGLAPSGGEATRLIKQRAVHVNGRLLTDEKTRLTIADAIEGEFFVVKKGKKELFLLRIQG